MHFFIFLLSFLGAKLFAASPDFYTRDLFVDPYPEVVGIAKLDPLGNHNIYCSGTAISNNKILTAAHCVAYGDGDGLKYPLENYFVHLGEGVVDRNLMSDEIEKLYSVKAITFHPLYGKTEYQFSHDVAVITLNKILPYDFEFHYLFNIPKKPFKILMVGFGVREDENTGSWITSDMKSYFEFNMESPRFYLNEEKEPNELQVVDREKIKGTCKGDSGGPVFIENREGRFLYAITSTGEMKEYEQYGRTYYGRCGYDSKATIIHKHLDFILENL